METTSKSVIVRYLRRNQTLAEQKMWWLLRSRAFCGYKFCRQYRIDHFVADFCCRRAKLVIELDGEHHLDNIEYDERRTRYLTEKGYRFLRFRNADFLLNPAVVLERVRQTLETCPLPRLRGRGCPKGG